MPRFTRRTADTGFSLVELMVVVIIIAILAAIAVVGYAKYVGRARTGEAMVILAEMVGREQTYKLEFGGYFPLRGDGNWASGTYPPEAHDGSSWGLNEDSTGFYPAHPLDAGFSSVRTAVSIDPPSGWPACWKSLGLRPREKQLYCTYLTNAGNALGMLGSSTPDNIPAGYGQRPLGTTSSVPWFYGLASCNLSGGQAQTLDDTSIFVVSSISATMGNYNDGK